MIFTSPSVKLSDYLIPADFAKLAGTYEAAVRFINTDQRSEFIYHSKAECLEIVAEMKAEYEVDWEAFQRSIYE